MSYRPHVAYVVSRFPVVTETFILRELDELERRGVKIDLYSLIKDSPDVLQESAAARVDALVAGSTFGVSVLVGTQIRWLRRRPLRLTRVWARSLWGNRGSLRFLLRAIAVVPVASVFAERIEASGANRVHAHWATHPALAAFVISQLVDIPYGVTAHAHDIYVDQAMLDEKLDAADLVVTVSEANRQYLVDRIPSLVDRCQVVRCGVTDLADAPRQRDELDRLEISCVASLKPYKGHRYLLRACRILADRGIDFRCSLAGSGTEEAGLRDLVNELQLDSYVQFLGALDSVAVSDLLGTTDVFVLASTTEASGKTEGIPVALMEAMAAGVPVVSSRVSSIPELIDDGASGLLVEPGDHVAIADAIVRLQADRRLRDDLATAALRRVADEFTVEANGARLAALFGLEDSGPNDHGPLVSAGRSKATTGGSGFGTSATENGSTEC